MTVVTTAIVIVTLIAGVLTSTWFAVRESRAKSELQATLQVLHEELIEKVILNAQSDNQQGTDAAMQLAEQSGVPPSTRQMLEGIAHYYKGENEPAIRDLKAVLDLEPNNVTARAMLALAHIHNGEWNEYVREILQVRESVETQDTLVRHDYETLILGCALFVLGYGVLCQTVKGDGESSPRMGIGTRILGRSKVPSGLGIGGRGTRQRGLERYKAGANAVAG